MVVVSIKDDNLIGVSVITMSKKIVTSTPHPRRRHIRDTLFDEDPISPIVQSGLHKDSNENCASKVRSAKPATKKNLVLPTNKKNEDKESASSAVLKELGAARMIQRPQFSQSFNLYNMYPQLVIVDSDEEGSVASSNSQKPQVKKEKKVSRPRAANIVNKAGETNNVKHRLDPNPELSERGREVKTTTAKTSGKTSSEVGKQKPPLSSIENTQKIVKRHKKAPVLKQCSTIFIESDNEESGAPLNLRSGDLTDSRKRKFLSLSVIGDQSEDEIITFTPRRIKGESKVNRVVNAEEASVQDIVENRVEIGGEISKKKCNKKPPNSYKKEAKESKSVDQHLKSPKEDNPVSKECFSQFKDIIFKCNQNTGGIIANSLKTDKLSFGYIEISGTFEGKRSGTTYTVLEGQVVATLTGGVKQEMSPGDILHIKSESGYKFENVGSVHARLLYVKENRSS
uniref:Cupin type-2 domain-containing protein n=1 Tax=Graphocephala atropunctata TaxID=36148 RepID=A0A1B6LZ03_9HEMI